jgi:uncharacterized RDD family membrane protein YckC
MLFRDLSNPEIPSSTSLKKGPAIASPGDRFLALVIDFLIFSPLVSFVGAGFLRKSKALFMLNPQSAEGLLLWIFFVAMGFMFTSFLQSLFWLAWQATPGQLFMQLKVVNHPGDEEKRLTYPQCLVRAVLWNISVLMCGVPFLDVLGHPLRRGLHERASDTMVVTLKLQADLGPVAIESRFIGTWMRFFFIGLALVGALFFVKSVDSLKKDLWAKSSASGLSCPQTELSELSGIKRIDVALSLFLLDGYSPDCLKKEADLVIWSDSNPEAVELAYVAKSLTVDDLAIQKQYVEKVCQVGEGEVCELAKFLAQTDETAGHAIEFKGAKDFLSSQVITMQTELEVGNYLSALQQIDKIQKEGSLHAAVEKNYVRAVWSLREQLSSGKKSRVPASADSKVFIQQFKEKYGVQ